MHRRIFTRSQAKIIKNQTSFAYTDKQELKMNQKIIRSASIVLIAFGIFSYSLMVFAQEVAPGPNPAAWGAVLNEAKGQTVYFNAWGGDPKINDFITWVGDVARSRYDILLQHVKLANTSDAVSRVRTEVAAKQMNNGSVDLIWINGENFSTMKDDNLLFGPFAQDLPNFQYVDTESKPATLKDFTKPTDGFESPWAMAQLVFEYDPQRVSQVPRTAADLLKWIKANPGRFTYPQPPDYLGTTFLKQILYATISDPNLLQNSFKTDTYAAESMKIWEWLDTAHPYMWHRGQAFPTSEFALSQLLADGEIAISIAFNPGRASAEIEAGNLNPNIRSFVFDQGTIGNASFVAIPVNSGHKAGALVLANLLLHPLVQARAQDPAVLGFMTVLDTKRLSAQDKEAFDQLDLGVATLSPVQLGRSLLEPDASWMRAIAKDWQKRYGVLK
ncbi:MAG: putative thiamine transport system substrate-binding protein [Paracoccaceae bacterium]|jgi:putative thiamine transport system substrate-binding protein